MKARFQQLTAAFAAAAAGWGSVACGNLARQGNSPTLLFIDNLTAASGAAPGQFSNVLASDVVTLVNVTVGGVTQKQPTIFADPGQVILRIQLKDIGLPAAETTP